MSQVSDASWSPLTSTVFALTTVDGKVHVYDLSINKYNPLCVQAIVNRLRGMTSYKMYTKTVNTGRKVV